MLEPEDIRQALRDCYDPEFALNVVDLGLIESIELADDQEAPGAGIVGVPVRQRLRVVLAGKATDEAALAMLEAQIVNRLLGLESLSRVSVEFSQDRMWSPARISAAGRRLLGLDQSAFPILNNRPRQRVD